jgi:hypothetical protein
MISFVNDDGDSNSNSMERDNNTEGMIESQINDPSVRILQKAKQDDYLLDRLVEEDQISNINPRDIDTSRASVSETASINSDQLKKS